MGTQSAAGGDASPRPRRGLDSPPLPFPQGAGPRDNTDAEDPMLRQAQHEGFFFKRPLRAMLPLGFLPLRGGPHADAPRNSTEHPRGNTMTAAIATEQPFTSAELAE